MTSRKERFFRTLSIYLLCTIAAWCFCMVLWTQHVVQEKAAWLVICLMLGGLAQEMAALLVRRRSDGDH